VGGLRLSEAAALIDRHLRPELRGRIEVRVAGRRRTVSPRFLRRRLDSMRSARRANIAARAHPGSAVDVAPRIDYSRARVRWFVRRIARLVGEPARDARLRFAVTKVAVRPGRSGYDIDRPTLRAAIAQALTVPGATRTIRAKGRIVPPRVTRADVLRRHPVIVTVQRRRFRLRVFRHGKRVSTYRVAVGMPGHQTPRGRFRIANKAIDPAWSAPDKPWAGAYRDEVVEGGAPDNPLKARWLGIVDGVGIHGTDATWSIGTAASHGCIRMAVPAVKRVYRLVPLGAPVLIK
jgi:lipoprotein-anchoring transpeptidase ErfK/SrfK